MTGVAEFMSFGWLEGSPAFDVLFGTLTGAACLALAIPILWWVLPKSRRRLFSERIDPHQYLQLAYGIFCMSMAFTDMLCRFIPHRPLGWVHPSFFLTTVALVAFLGPQLAVVAFRGRTSPLRASPAALRLVLAAFVAFPVSAVVNAFWF